MNLAQIKQIGVLKVITYEMTQDQNTYKVLAKFCVIKKERNIA